MSVDAKRISISALRAKSDKRRKQLTQNLGLASADQLSEALHSKSDQDQIRCDKIEIENRSESKPEKKPDPEKVDEYTDSSTFLKGTNSQNPHNDYCQNFIDTGQYPSNYIRDVSMEKRFAEYPKLNELIEKKDLVAADSHCPPTYLHADLRTFVLTDLECQFDSIIIDAPLEEYKTTATNEDYWNWDDIMKLDIESISAPRSFIFLWCGSTAGTDFGRQCLQKWGFRRCEDICWIKTNLNRARPKMLQPSGIFYRVKEHCLMGIKGTVRRSTDGDFIHANIDIDLLIDEEREVGNAEKPHELFDIVERFCLGRRRLHLFGRDSCIRPGWLTVGPRVTNSNFSSPVYQSHFKDGILIKCTDEIERLRPKSPPVKRPKVAPKR